MAESYDLILKGGTVVNQDGEGVRDLAIAGGRIAAIGDVGVVGRRDDRLPRPACPAGRDRQPRAFPRARPDPQGGPGNRLARRGAGRRHRGVRDAQHRADRPPAPRRWPTRSSARITACIAISPSTSARTRENTHELGELERLPGACGVKVFMGSSTGSLLIEDDEGVRNVLKADPPPRRRSIPRTNTGCASACTCASRAIRARIRSGATPPRR